MTNDSLKFGNSKKSKFVFFLSILVTTFWLLVNLIDVYKYKIVGVFSELLWLPMLAGLFVLPILSFIFLIKERFSLKSLYFYSILLIGGIFTFMMIK